MTNRNVAKLQKDYEVVKGQSQFVAMKNELAQKGTFNLTALEYKVVLFIISKIKPDDKPETEYQFKISDFTKICKLDNSNTGTYYKYIRNIIKKLRTKPILIQESEDVELITGWFNDARFYKKTGIVGITFSHNVIPYLFNLRLSGNYFQFLYEYGITLENPRGIKLYMYFKSILYKSNIVVFSIEALRKILECEDGKYTTFKDFRRYVIELVINDINKNSDLYVDYEIKMEGRKATQIQFIVNTLDKMFI